MKNILLILLFLVVVPIYGQDLPPPSYNSIGLKVNFDKTFDSVVMQSEILMFLKREQIGTIEKTIINSHLSIAFKDSIYTITQLPEERVIYKIDNSKPNKTLQLIKDKISQFAYGFSIKNLSLRNESFKFSFRIKPIDNKLKEIPLGNYPKTYGNLNFNTSNSSAILEVTNLSDNPIYFSIIELNSKGELNSFIPNIKCALLGRERRLEPKQTISINTCVFNFAPPYETLTLKGFASAEPINFDPIIRNKNNASLEYIKEFYTEMFTYEFKYNIVDENGEMPYTTQIDEYKINTSPELEKAILEIKKLNLYKYDDGSVSFIKQNTVLNLQYLEKLNEISKLHKSLGNSDEAKDNARRHARLKSKLDYANKLSQKKSIDKSKKEAAKKAMLFQKMTDAEKIAYLKKENKTKNILITELQTQIIALNEQIKTLSNPIGNGLSRGAKPKKKEIDIVSEFTYRALIIAEENYTDENISDLKFPIDDATELKEVLINNYAFDDSNVTFLKDPTRKDIFKALDKLFKSSSDKDHLLIFYAGHGVYDEDFKRGYWLPSDAEMDNKSSWMSNLDIKDYISNIKTKHTLLISDACFSGSIFEYNRNVNTTTSNKAVEKLLKKNARNAMTSGLDKPVPDESVFIKYLLKTLKENKTLHLKASNLFSTIQEVVLNNTENIPQYGVIQNANHEGGEFIFLKRE